MQVIDVLYLAEVDAELFDSVQHLLIEECDLCLDQALEEQRKDSHDALLPFLILNAPTLVDLLIQVSLNILVWQLYSLRNLREDFQRVGGDLDVL